MWAADNPGNIAIRAELLAGAIELAGNRFGAGGEILDIGSGGGWLLAELIGAGVSADRLHGVDLIGTRVEAARRRAAGARLRLADARALPYDANRFEVVTLFTCLSSMRREAASIALREAARVTAASGMVLCYEPILPNPFNQATRRVGAAELRAGLGSESAVRRLTGFPPLARRLGKTAPRAYRALSRMAPTHRLGAYLQGPT